MVSDVDVDSEVDSEMTVDGCRSSMCDCDCKLQ